MYLPIVLIVLSNVFYHICSKETPADINPFASLTVTYAVGFLASLLLFLITGKGSGLLAEYRHVNWAVIVFGLSIVGLEAGYIAMYKAGWNISRKPHRQRAVGAGTDHCWRPPLPGNHHTA